MEGKLSLCATLLGNIEDITFRVVRILKDVYLIAAEDTRHSIKLLNHFNITTPMTSYHEFNKYDKAKYLVEQMKTGRSVACITDAGTPGISDPGEELVRQCMEEGIERSEERRVGKECKCRWWRYDGAGKERSGGGHGGRGGEERGGVVGGGLG